MATGTPASTVSAPAGPAYGGKPLSGLSGLYGNMDPDPNQTFDEGVEEAHANDPHPGHATYGSNSPGELPYSGTSYGPAGQSLAAGDSFSPFTQLGTDEPLDLTPTSHRTPYPRGIRQQSWDTPDGLADAGTQMRQLHGTDQGGPRKFNAFAPGGLQDGGNDVTVDRYGSPDDHVLSANIPGQIRGAGQGGVGSMSGKDSVQGYGSLNNAAGDEFSHGHSMRYVGHSSLAFDRTGTGAPDARPFLGKLPNAQARFDGPDSPYYDAGGIDHVQVMMRSGGASFPSPYTPPPDPTVLPAMVVTDSPFAEY